MTNICKPLGQLFDSKVDREMKLFLDKMLGNNNEPSKACIYKLNTRENKTKQNKQTKV